MNPFLLPKNHLRKKGFLEKINDDLNMPETMSVLWDMLKDDDLNSSDKLALINQLPG